MRKLPYYLDNPIDNLLIYISESSKHIFYYLYFTPNMITSLALITSTLGINEFIHSNYIVSCLLFNLSYFFDCLDGHYARSYNMVTVFGDYYDHLSDLFKFFGLLITSYYINYCKFQNLMLFLPFLIITMLLQLSCQEAYYSQYSNTNAPTLKILKYICPASNNIELQGIMKVTRYFGTGTLNVIFSLIPIYYGYY